MKQYVDVIVQEYFTLESWRNRFGGMEGVYFREKPFSCLAHSLNPETVAARLT